MGLFKAHPFCGCKGLDSDWKHTLTVVFVSWKHEKVCTSFKYLRIIILHKFSIFLTEYKLHPRKFYIYTL